MSVINTNMSALFASDQLANTQSIMQKDIQELSSGLKINSAKDNAAGLAISQGMQAQINGFQQASQNAQDGNSLLQTAEGAMTQQESILQTMRTLAVQASNTTYTTADRNKIVNEMQNLQKEITRLGTQTQFNNKTLLNGSFSGVLHIGANSGQVISVALTTMTAGSLKVSAGAVTMLGSAGGTNAKQVSAANAFITTIDNALTKVNNQLSTIGGYQNRLSYTIANLQTSTENLTAAKSGITDADIATTMSDYTRQQILSQSGSYMLSQANQTPQTMLSLFK